VADAPGNIERMLREIGRACFGLRYDERGEVVGGKRDRLAGNEPAKPEGTT
jgi:hypothetical protein